MNQTLPGPKRSGRGSQRISGLCGIVEVAKEGASPIWEGDEIRGDFSAEQSGLQNKEEQPDWHGEARKDQTGRVHGGPLGIFKKWKSLPRLDQRHRGERWARRLEESRFRPVEAPEPGEIGPQDEGGLTTDG